MKRALAQQITDAALDVIGVEVEVDPDEEVEQNPKVEDKGKRGNPKSPEKKLDYLKEIKTLCPNCDIGAITAAFGTYYKPEPGVSISDVQERWKAGDKVDEDAMPILFKTSEVWPHREYTWTREGARSGYAIVDGKRALLPGPLKWDAIAADMKKKGWRLSEQPCVILLGQDGSSKVGEGNHRLAIAKSIGLKRIPVRFEFYTGKVTKSKQGGDEVIDPMPKVKKKVIKKAVERTEPRTPAEQKQIDDIMELLGM